MNSTQAIQNPLFIVRRDWAAVAKLAGFSVVFGLLATQFDISWFTPESLDNDSKPRPEVLINGFGWVIIVISGLLTMQLITKPEIFLVGFEGLVAPKISGDLVRWNDIEAIFEVPHAADTGLAIYLHDGVLLRGKPLAMIMQKVNSEAQERGDLCLTFANADDPTQAAIDAISNHFPVVRLR